ncbi:MAG: hypothetical protein GXY83_16925 [Rhodopirellula sp.]|nr:hypothetical protein [Rhodopirellula sp.]
MPMKLRILVAAFLSLVFAGNADADQKTPLPWPASLEQYHKRFAEFDKEDAENMPAPGCTVFAGSSSITGWKLIPEDFQDVNAINRGFGGAILPQWLLMVDRYIIRYKPARVVFYCGENDIARKHSPATVRDNLETLLEQIHTALPETEIYFVSLKPSPSRWKLWPAMTEANRLCKELCDRLPHATYVDVSEGMLGENGEPRKDIFRDDNLHMNRTGYTEIWIPRIRKAFAENVVLRNSTGQLRVNPSGAMCFTTESSDCPVWSVRPDQMWVITLAKGESPFKLSDAIDFTPGNQNVPKFSAIEDGVEFRYDSLRHGEQIWDVGLTLQVRRAGDEFEFLGKVENRAGGWCVQHFKFPILFDIQKSGADHQGLAVLLPSCLGERVATPEKLGKLRRFTYPSGQAAAMQYSVIDGGEAGLYLACHDQTRSRKTFAIANRGSSYDFSLENEPYCMSGQSWSSAPAVAMPYAGTWHTAARRYRAWSDTWMRRAPMPDWVRNQNAGWFLCILKQQNGDLMFRYNELDRVADIADKWGLDVLGLFGWAHGGHDRDYPDYIPDPKMGGPEELKAAIERVQKRGKKVMLYANGQLLDTASAFYKEHGVECTSLQPDGKPYADRYNKFKSTPDPTFARACFGSERWYQRLYELGVQAQDLGADGLIYDQFGIGGPGFCYNESHGHARPNEAWAECRFQLTKRLTEALRARRPDFVLMTEWVIDGLMQDFPYFHGCGNGFYPFTPTSQEKNFLELFFYTFPEIIATQRNPNPMSTRNVTNQACLYGMQHETESRYVADVKYLGGTLPAPEDYADCNSPPNVPAVCSTPLEPAAKYLREVIAMRDRFADFFKRGRFIDTEGFVFEGQDSVARGFLAQDGRLGIVVWNHGDKPQAVSVSAQGRNFLGVFTSGETEPVGENQPVPSESVRFFLWSAKGTGNEPH